MKTTLTSLPGMYADWSTLGWSMILGKPPTGAGMEPTVNPFDVAAKQEPAKQGASKQPKKAKPAARKAQAKPAARKTKVRSAAPAKKRRVAAKRR